MFFLQTFDSEVFIRRQLSLSAILLVSFLLLAFQLLQFASAERLMYDTPFHICVKTAETSAVRVSLKSQKRFRDTPRFKLQAVLARIQPFLSRSVEKTGRPIPI